MRTETIPEAPQHPWRPWVLQGSIKADEAALRLPLNTHEATVFWLRIMLPENRVASLPPLEQDFLDLHEEVLLTAFAAMVAAPQHNYVVETRHQNVLRWWTSSIPSGSIRQRAAVLVEQATGRRIVFKGPDEVVPVGGTQAEWPPKSLWIAAAVHAPGEQLDSAMRGLLISPIRRRILCLRSQEFTTDIGKYVFCPTCHGDRLLVPLNDARQPISRGTTCLRCDGRGVLFPGSLTWVVLGGNGGNVRPGKRTEKLIAQCRKAEIPVYLEALGSEWGSLRKRRHPDGALPEQWPVSMRVRQVPEGFRPEHCVVPWLVQALPAGKEAGQ